MLLPPAPTPFPRQRFCQGRWASLPPWAASPTCPSAPKGWEKKRSWSFPAASGSRNGGQYPAPSEKQHLLCRRPNRPSMKNQGGSRPSAPAQCDSAPNTARPFCSFLPHPAGSHPRKRAGHDAMEPEEGFPSASLSAAEDRRKPKRRTLPLLSAGKFSRREQKDGRLALPALGEKTHTGQALEPVPSGAFRLPRAAEGLEHRFAWALQKNQKSDRGAGRNQRPVAIPLSRLRHCGSVRFSGG